jgi:hypothetical protein
VQNLDFDFQQFATSAIKAIDEIRSYSKDGKKANESRINAFYRSIGLPAVKTPAEQPATKNTGTANLVDSSGGLPADFAQTLKDRESQFAIQADKAEYSNELHLNTRPLSHNMKGRKRGSMWPALVNADIEITPQSKRIAAAFDDEVNTLIDNGSDKMRAPLIEFIINTRAKEIGIQDTTLQDKVVGDFANAFKGATIAVDTGNALNVTVSQTLRKAIITAASEFHDAITEAGKAVSKVGNVYAGTEGNIPEQNPEDFGNALETKPSVDVQEQYQNEKDAINQGFLTLFEYTDGDGTGRRNLTDSMFASSVVSLLSAQDVKTKKDKQNTAKQKSKGAAQVKKAFKGMDLFLGDFAGISGLDILIVFCALFEISLASLVGLLNSDIRNKMQKNSSVKNVQASPFPASLSELEEKLKQLYEFAEKNLQQRTSAHK